MPDLNAKLPGLSCPLAVVMSLSNLFSPVPNTLYKIHWLASDYAGIYAGEWYDKWFEPRLV